MTIALATILAVWSIAFAVTGHSGAPSAYLGASAAITTSTGK